MSIKPRDKEEVLQFIFDGLGQHLKNSVTDRYPAIDRDRLNSALHTVLTEIQQETLCGGGPSQQIDDVVNRKMTKEEGLRSLINAIGPDAAQKLLKDINII